MMEWRNEWQQMVADFHRKHGARVSMRPTDPDFVLDELDRRLIEEEAFELDEALDLKGLPEIAKEMCDVIYVVLGRAVTLGIDLAPIFKAVHDSNMSKAVGLKDEHGKVLKGPDYKAPDIDSLIKQQQFATNSSNKDKK